MAGLLAKLVIKYRFILIGIWVLALFALTIISPVGIPPENLSSKVTENQRAGQILSKEFPSQNSQDSRAQGYIILVDPQGFNDRDLKTLTDLGVWLALPVDQSGPGNIEQVVSPSNVLARGQLLSQDKQAGLVIITFTFKGTNLATFDTIESHLIKVRDPGTTLEFTGQPAILAAQDKVLKSVIGEGISPSLIASLLLVLLILGYVYRSPLAVLVPLIAISAVVYGSLMIVNLGKYGGWLPTSNFTAEFVIIVVFGAGTNYCLFLLSRYREELLSGKNGREAIEITLAAVGEAISSSAATVIAAMAVMGFAQSNLFRSIGPAVALSVALMLIAGLTLVPAMIFLVGNALFWPLKIKPTIINSGGEISKEGVWNRIGRLVVKFPIQVIAGCVLLLLPLALLASQVEPSYNDLRTLPHGNQAVSGIENLQKHFGGGIEMDSLIIYNPNLDLSLSQNKAGIELLIMAAKSLTETKQIGQIQFSESKQAARIPITLGIESDSLAARQTIDHLDTALQQTLSSTLLKGSEVVLRGSSVNTRDASLVYSEDFSLILVSVSVIIYLILAVLVRSFTAPIYLLATIALSSGTSIGLTYLVFHVFLAEEIHFTAPIFAFVFLVALGEDFNILLMSRISEETLKLGLVRGIAKAVGSTGGTLTSCGLIMAGTFSVFSTSSLTILHQIGFAVMAGVLMDTFIVRSMLVPSIVRLLGKWNWVGIHGPLKLPAEGMLPLAEVEAEAA